VVRCVCTSSGPVYILENFQKKRGVMASPLKKILFADIQGYVKQDLFWLVRECSQSTGKALQRGEDWLSEESYRTFALWYNDAYGEALPVEKKKPSKRAFSTSHRIEVAFRQRYRCAHCRILLPPDFQIDHVVELRHGGEDTYENLAALCVACHSKKTRANTLKEHAAFCEAYTKRANDIEENIFKNLAFKPTRSKYFPINKGRE